MKRAVVGPLLAVGLLAFGALAAGAEELTVHSILAAHQSGASPHGFQIVKGDRYRFQDSGRESGSNAAVVKVMDALRAYFPSLAFGAPEN
jgi:hypothetical protein